MKDTHATGYLTDAVELEPRAIQERNSPISSKDRKLANSATSANLAGSNATTGRNERESDLETLSAESRPDQPPTVVALALEKWNDPTENISRLFSTYWSFVIMGANDAAYGVSARFTHFTPKVYMV